MSTEAKGGSRRYDVTVFGCTGNAGRAVALELLKASAGSKLNVAFAGRTRKKVEATKRSILTELNDVDNITNAIDPDIIVADASDLESMVAMTKQTKVYVACAGPFGRFGESSVRACVKTKTHYLDITGEIPWVNRMIATYGEDAKRAGITLLPFSGYDCVPAEIAMVLGSQLVQKQSGKSMENLDIVFRAKGGGFPKGTLKTVIDGVEMKLYGKKTRPVTRKTKTSFVPAAYKRSVKQSIGAAHWLFPAYSKHAGRFTAANFMSAVNVPVLARGAAAMQVAPFTISDRTALGPKSIFSLFGLLPVLIYQFVLFIAGFLLVTPCFRWWLKRRLKSYNFHGNKNGRVLLDAVARSANDKTRAKVSMMIRGDPGIYATGVLAAAVSLALLDACQSRDAQPDKGFSTPAVALRRGNVLIKRLRQGGVAIDASVNGKPVGSTE